MYITSSTLIFKIIVPKILFPIRKTKITGGELSPNEVLKVKAVKNHGAFLYTPNKEMNKHLK